LNGQAQKRDGKLTFMPDLLFELGCEELPAGSIERAAQNLKESVEKRLRDCGVGFEAQEPLFTPRRLIVSLKNVDKKQPDQNKVQRGPALGAAFDAEGKPTKALEGFCKGQGVNPTEVVVEGEYVWVKKEVPGRETIELLQEILPSAIGDIQFSKTMRWGDGTFRFARPIRWILASLGGKTVSFSIEGVHSGILSRGHRFRAPGEFEAMSLDDLVTGLRSRFVEPSFKERRAKILEQTKVLTGQSNPSNDLVDENANLTEWPEALIGEFKPEFLELPIPVLTTVMAKHERFFPMPDGMGGLKSQFVSIRNGGEEGAVRKGNAWVLNARFNDARFFFEEDKKHSLAEFLERTSSMAFQEKLGSVRQRCDRLAVLAGEVALWSGSNEEEAGFANQAGLYAKADLSTGLVSELDELQGVIGGEYARREGFVEPVCWAIASHYDLTKNPSPDSVGARTAVRLLIADQLDRLAGFMGTGYVPTGSSDPYGLRRSVTLLIESSWSWLTVLPGFNEIFHKAVQGYTDQGFELHSTKAVDALKEVFSARYHAMLGARHDLCEAAALPGDALLDPRGVRMRLSVMIKLASDTTFVQASTRPANIVAAALKKGIDFGSTVVSAESLQSAEADDLWTAVRSQGPLAEKASQAEDAEGVVMALRPLISPVNAFFDSTMVMVDDVSVRDARLKMLSECEEVLRIAGDFTKVVIEG